MGEMKVIANEHAVYSDAPGPVRLLPGGGKRLKAYDGRVLVIGGESLRNCLRQHRVRRPLIDGAGIGSDRTNAGPVFAGGYVADGKEIVVDVANVAYWVSRGGMDLGPVWKEEGEEPLNLQRGPSSAEQDLESRRRLIAGEIEDSHAQPTTTSVHWLP